MKLYNDRLRAADTPLVAGDGRRSQSISRLRLAASQQDTGAAAGIIGELLATVGAGRLAQLLVETVHTQADHLAMAGRADEALALRRQARVISRAARDLTTAAKSNGAP